MTPFGLIHVKDVDIIDRLKLYYTSYSNEGRLKRNDEF